MTRGLKYSLLKISALTSIFVLISIIFWSWLSAFLKNNNSENLEEETNENTFKSATTTLLWKTWVAMATNLWTKFTEISEYWANIYTDIMWITEGLQLSTASGTNSFMSKNMSLTEEYRNVLKTDIKWLLAQSTNKSKVLETIIWQLEYRYKLSVEQMKSLLNERTKLESEITIANSQIESLKSKISSDFLKNDSDASYENINKYLELRSRYNYAVVYTVYINQFLNDYNRLNEYNKKLLDVLINNKDAIVKEAFVVIPDTGVELLRDFNLLYDEAEYKSSQKN